MVTKSDIEQASHLFIAEWMEKRGISDERLAIRLGVARETVTRWRNQQHRLNPGKIARIASVLGLDPRDLWHDPERGESLDALIRNAPAELQETAADIIRRLMRR